MKIQYTGQKTTRFDINKDLMQNNVLLDRTIIDFRFEYGVQNVPEKHIWIGLKISSYILESESKKEFLAYSSDFRGIAYPENQKKDLNDLILFIENGLLNFQSYFQNNAPKEISLFQLIGKTNELEYANNFMEMLLEDGIIYPN